MVYKRVIYKIKKDSFLKLKRTIHSFLKSVEQHEPDTLIYEVYQLDNKITFIHYMAFKDRRAERIHSTAQHTRDFAKKLYPLCIEKPKFNILSLIDKKGR